jgi:L-2-hydroxycarboxylate dehydrogenase (NAD+)
MTAPLPRYDVERLTGFTTAVLERAGVRPADAATSAEILVTADVYGIESHGIARLGYYAGLIGKGLIDLEATPAIERETAVTAAIDARNGFGPPSARWAMTCCVGKAAESGMAIVTVRNSNHFGIAGYYAMMAASRGLVGMAATNAGPQVVPAGGLKPMLGTNPLAVAVPAGRERPFLLDMATSTVSWGKIEIARRAGRAIPPGWALDSGGEVATDPETADLMLPLGSGEARAGHKGYGLAALVDILCGPLAGAAFGPFVSGMRTRPPRPSGIGHFFAAWRPDAFRPVEEFRADMDGLIRALHDSAPAPGHDRVRVAGDPELDAEQERRAHGVPIHPAVLADLEAIGARMGVPFPARAAAR